MGRRRHELHALVDRLDDEAARRLAETLRGIAAGGAYNPRPLTEADIVRTDPVMPDGETADDLIAAVRRWRREGGVA